MISRLIWASSHVVVVRPWRAVAATDRERLGSNHRSARYFVDALRSSDTVFTTVQTEAGGFDPEAAQGAA